MRKIFIVALNGAGNLGDDLISIILVDKLNKKFPNSVIGVLIHEEQNQFQYPADCNLKLFKNPRLSDFNTFLKRKNEIKEYLKQVDLLVIGGGGLIEDTHFPFTVHGYLNYLFKVSKKTQMICLGIGIGPLKYYLTRFYLKNVENYFSLIQVRDKESANYIRNNNIINYSCDIVEGTNLNSYLGNNRLTKRNILGCSIRPWKGLKSDQLIAMISKICLNEKKSVEFYVFEYSKTNTSEYDFAIQLKQILSEKNIKSDVYCYNQDPLDLFISKLFSVEKAIAIRFHANILWQKMGVPVIPVSYAPKVTSLYSKNGLNIQNINSIYNSDEFYSIDLNHEYIIPEIPANVKIKHRNNMLYYTFNILEFMHLIVYKMSLGIKKIINCCIPK